MSKKPATRKTAAIASLPKAPTWERLDAMHNALHAVASEGTKLDVQICLEINQALVYIGARMMADISAKRRGRTIAWNTLSAATIAAALMDKHGASASNAARAALPRGTKTERDNVEHACRTLRRRMRRKPRIGDAIVVVSPSLVADAVRRLPHIMRK
jgi:hypothetical protein